MRKILLLALFFPALARAEYRVFELIIQVAGQPDRVEISNLDPREYRHFYPVPLEAKIGYRATWMCKGNTSWYQAICPNPRATAPAL